MCGRATSQGSTASSLASMHALPWTQQPEDAHLELFSLLSFTAALLRGSTLGLLKTSSDLAPFHLVVRH